MEKGVKAMARRVFCLILAAMFIVCQLPIGKAETGLRPALRALLLACDDFVTQPDTAPSSYNNLIALRRALLYDARGYRSIRVGLNQALDAEGFAALARDAFSGAVPGDISLFYLSTHGIQVDGSADFFALLSDGESETHLSAGDIHRALEGIPGTKIIILDACYSGAAINKGGDVLSAFSAFTGPDFKVLTSAGALEPSFLWTDGKGTVQGGSFFAQALTEGLSSEGAWAADMNRDGQITLNELYNHQLIAYGASTPQVYPQNDNTVALAYRPGLQAGRLRTVTGLYVDSPVITDSTDPLWFSYTLNRESRLAYQLIYQQQGVWRFQHPQSIADPGRGDGLVLPGRKEVALRLQPQMEALSGYVLMMLVSVVEDRSRPQACVLMSVQTKPLPQAPSIKNAPAFEPGAGEEMPFLLLHGEPVLYSAFILDNAGRQVASLGHQRMSRPLHLKEEGSALYWDGSLQDGSPAPAGLYRLSARLTAGGESYTALGEPFELLGSGQ